MINNDEVLAGSGMEPTPNSNAGANSEKFLEEDLNVLKECKTLEFGNNEQNGIKEYLYAHSHLTAYYFIGGCFADKSFACKYFNPKGRGYLTSIINTYTQNDKLKGLVAVKTIINTAMQVSINSVGVIDEDVVIAELKGMFPKKQDIETFITCINYSKQLYLTKNEVIKHFFDCEVKKFSALADIKNLTHKFFENVCSEDGMCDDKFGQMLTSYVGSVLQEKKYYDTDDDDVDYYDYDTLMQAIQNNYVPTGIRFIDEKTGGGFRKQGVSLLSAPSGGGKTQWAVAVAEYNTRHNLRVLHIDLEMDKPQLITRYLARLSGVPAKQMPSFGKQNPTEFRQFLGYLNKLDKDNYLHIIAEKPMSVDDIRTHLETQKQLGIEYDLVIVDYIDELRNNDASKDRYQAQYDNIRALNQMAIDYNVAVFTMSQMVKEQQGSKKKDSDKSNATGISGSVGKTYKASLSIIVDNKDPKEYTVHIEKVRGTDLYDLPIQLTIDFGTARISNKGESRPADYKDKEDEELQRIVNLHKYNYENPIATKTNDKDDLKLPF